MLNKVPDRFYSMTKENPGFIMVSRPKDMQPITSLKDVLELYDQNLSTEEIEKKVQNCSLKVLKEISQEAHLVANKSFAFLRPKSALCSKVHTLVTSVLATCVGDNQHIATQVANRLTDKTGSHETMKNTIRCSPAFRQYAERKNSESGKCVIDMSWLEGMDVEGEVALDVPIKGFLRSIKIRAGELSPEEEELLKDLSKIEGDDLQKLQQAVDSRMKVIGELRESFVQKESTPSAALKCYDFPAMQARIPSFMAYLNDKNVQAPKLEDPSIQQSLARGFFRSIESRADQLTPEELDSLEIASVPEVGSPVNDDTDINQTKAEKPLKVARLAEMSAYNSEIGLESIELDAQEPIHDPSKLYFNTCTMTVGADGDDSPKLEISVARRKGTEGTTKAKAMSEDFVVREQVQIQLNGQTFNIPFTAILDGGGGHALAQYGAEHLANEFQKELQVLVNKGGVLTQALVAKALRRADDSLFSREPLGGGKLQGRAYQFLREKHAQLEKEIAPANLEEFVCALDQGLVAKWMHSPHDIFLILKGEYSGELLVNKKRYPLKAGEYDEEARAAIKSLHAETGHEFSFAGKKYDLSDEGDARELAHLHELSLGTELRIEVQSNLCAYIPDGDGVQCVSVNRGDSFSYYTGSTDESDPWQAVSLIHTSLKYTRSALPLGAGLLVSCCDGHRELLTREQLKNWDGKANQLGAEEYVLETMQASVQFGGGDDKTIMAVKLVKN